MSGFKNATDHGGYIVIARTCDGDGAWECSNLLEPGERLCEECQEDEED